ncbi:hypothetical protein D2E26_0041 [Bifidobacterium dolichotidis]|uniref:Uncharacterized protein n=1 Tax=Bifidobacterium dolichotidis TaxID=2306976 RepID=A0A430FRI4_9BIFI|nr:hypothetical protein [Bifidobacterium dolichotidis]RSX55478.1 hypothetical protein D2E26_0041 [Bifidobacterium dolichotidis]
MASTEPEQAAGSPITVTGPADRKPYIWLIAAQAVAYAILVLISLIPMGSGAQMNSVAVTFVSTAVVALVVIEAFTSPLRVNASGRAIAAIAALFALVFATSPIIGDVIALHGAAQHNHIFTERPCTWVAGVASVLVAVIVIDFIRQMMREQRTELIEHIGADVALSASCVLSTGWCFLPYVLQNFGIAQDDGSTALHISVLLLAIICVGVIIALAAATYIWHHDVHIAKHFHLPWLGMAMLPVMLTGAVVGLGAVVITIWG